MSRPRRSRNFIVPVALTVAAAGLGLYLWLGNKSNAQSSSAPRPNQVHDEGMVEQPSQPKPRPNPGQKRTIAVVVREDSVGLLWNLPTPLNLSTTNLFILVHSPGSGGNPERVYKLAGDVFPKDYPREYIMPYTVETALLSLLRHLAPEAVYMDESLVGEGGAAISGLLEGNWVGAVVVAVGDQGKGKNQVDGWRQNVQRFGRRCAIIQRSGIRGDWASRVG